MVRSLQSSNRRLRAALLKTDTGINCVEMWLSLCRVRPEAAVSQEQGWRGQQESEGGQLVWKEVKEAEGNREQEASHRG